MQKISKKIKKKIKMDFGYFYASIGIGSIQVGL